VSDSVTVTCANCGATLDEWPSLPPDHRSPCDTCGSTARRFLAELRGTITATGSLDVFPDTATVAAAAFDATVDVQPGELQRVGDLDLHITVDRIGDAGHLLRVTDTAGHEDVIGWGESDSALIDLGAIILQWLDEQP
jgi:hypothetical protein